MLFWFFARDNGKWTSRFKISVFKISVKTLIQPPPHTQKCTHLQGRQGRKGKTMELAVSSLIFICLLSYFLLSLKHSKKEEEVTTSRIFSKPSSEHRIFRGIYLKIINKRGSSCTITGSEVTKQVNHLPMSVKKTTWSLRCWKQGFNHELLTSYTGI